MSVAQMYGLKNCSTCVKAQKSLTTRQRAFQFTDYRDHPIPAALLTDWAGRLGGFDKLVNRASAPWRSLSEAQKTNTHPEHWLDLIAQHPTLIKRPLLVLGDGQLALGYSEKKYDELFA